MSEKSNRTPWDFSSALQVLNSFSSSEASGGEKLTHDIFRSAGDSSPLPISASLGDFSRIWPYISSTDNNSPSKLSDLEIPPFPSYSRFSDSFPDQEKATYASDGAIYRPPSRRKVWRDKRETILSEDSDDGKTITPPSPSKPSLTPTRASVNNKKTGHKKKKNKSKTSQKPPPSAPARYISDIEPERTAPANKAGSHATITVLKREPTHSYNLRSKNRISTASPPPLETPEKEKRKCQTTQPKSSELSSAAAISTSGTVTRGGTFKTPPHPETVAFATYQLQQSLQNQFVVQIPAHVPFTTAPTVLRTTTQQKAARRDRFERDLALRLALIRSFPEDKPTLTRNVTFADHAHSPDGLHVFIDFSNIWIGFMEHLKRLIGLDSNQRLAAPDRNLSFESLVFLLERGRPVSKRVLVGSAPLLPAFDVARRIGYETNILDKVLKARDTPKREKQWPLQFNFLPQGGIITDTSPMPIKSNALHAGSASGEPEPVTDLSCSPEKWVEQGVDELLHLKMLESVVDYDAGTIVLATGDAAEAEYSDGFMKMVERALDKGWKVELVAWSRSISRLYRRRDWVRQWGDRFKVVELDGFAEFVWDT